MKFTSRYLTFKDDVKSAMPDVKNVRRTKASNILNIPRIVIWCTKMTGIENSITAITKWTKFDNTIDIGIIALGKKLFLIRFLSQTIDGVALFSDKEKKFQTSKPINK